MAQQALTAGPESPVFKLLAFQRLAADVLKSVEPCKTRTFRGFEYDPQAARCGAQTRSGAACQGPAMANGRCRMHGGPSTGPRTPEGLANSRQAQWKHGLYSAERKRLRRQLRWVGEFARVLSRIDKMFPNATRVCTSSPLGAFASYRRSLSSA